MSKAILIVDAEPDASCALARHLIEAGFGTLLACDGLEALNIARLRQPVLVLLDTILPGIDGFEVCKELRSDRATSAIPIIMLTASSSELDCVLGFELGVDDYVREPVHPRELVIRIRRLIAADGPVVMFRCGSMEIDVARHSLKVAGEPVSLAPAEFKCLVSLARLAGRIQTREQLMLEVWGGNAPTDPRSGDFLISRLRRKLGAAGALLETVKGFGYRLKVE